MSCSQAAATMSSASWSPIPLATAAAADATPATCCHLPEPAPRSALARASALAAPVVNVTLDTLAEVGREAMASHSTALAAVCPPQVGELRSERGPRHLVEIERWVKLAQNRALELVEAVGVNDGHSHNAQVLAHPARQRGLTDLRFFSGRREDRSQAQPEGRELVSPAEVHLADTSPQRVVRLAPAARSRGSREAGVDHARHHDLTDPSPEIC